MLTLLTWFWVCCENMITDICRVCRLADSFGLAKISATARWLTLSLADAYKKGDASLNKIKSLQK